MFWFSSINVIIRLGYYHDLSAWKSNGIFLYPSTTARFICIAWCIPVAKMSAWYAKRIHFKTLTSKSRFINIYYSSRIYRVLGECHVSCSSTITASVSNEQNLHGIGRWWSLYRPYPYITLLFHNENNLSINSPESHVCCLHYLLFVNFITTIDVSEILLIWL